MRNTRRMRTGKRRKRSRSHVGSCLCHRLKRLLLVGGGRRDEEQEEDEDGEEED